MRCQPAICVALSLSAGALLACGKQNTAMSQGTSVSATADSPDLSLRGVAFVRTADGRITARGTADRLDYRRAGGRLDAEVTAMTLVPQPGGRLATFGLMHFVAPHAKGEVGDKRGNAWGGVRFESDRGDHASTEAVEYADDQVRGDRPVTARGPGYTMHGNGLLAKGDGSEVTLTNGASGTLEASP
jgi:Lipopolysaccharide-assembly, LptC-related